MAGYLAMRASYASYKEFLMSSIQQVQGVPNRFADIFFDVSDQVAIPPFPTD